MAVPQARDHRHSKRPPTRAMPRSPSVCQHAATGAPDGPVGISGPGSWSPPPNSGDGIRQTRLNVAGPYASAEPDPDRSTNVRSARPGGPPLDVPGIGLIVEDEGENTCRMPP